VGRSDWGRSYGGGVTGFGRSDWDAVTGGRALRGGRASGHGSGAGGGAVSVGPLFGCAAAVLGGDAWALPLPGPQRGKQ
jgi:hypothetical protein